MKTLIQKRAIDLATGLEAIFKATVRRRHKKIQSALAHSQKAIPNTHVTTKLIILESETLQLTSFILKGQRVCVELQVTRGIGHQGWSLRRQPSFILMQQIQQPLTSQIFQKLFLKTWLETTNSWRLQTNRIESMSNSQSIRLREWLLKTRTISLKKVTFQSVWPPKFQSKSKYNIQS